MSKSEVVTLNECHYTFDDDSKNEQNVNEEVTFRHDNTTSEDKDYLEGGWGFVVWICMGLTMSIQFGEFTSATMMFNDYLVQICGGEAAAFKLLMTTSTFAIIFSGIGIYLLNRILKKSTTRVACIFGALLYNCGDLILVWMTSSVHYFIAVGFLKGLSMGIMITVQLKVLNGYFMKLRVTMMSLAMILPCAAGMCFPLLVAYLRENMGLQGTAMIMLAINFNLIGFACAMVEYKPKLPAKKAFPEIPSEIPSEIMKLKINTVNEVDDKCLSDEKLSNGNNHEKLPVKSSINGLLRVWLLKVFSESELNFLCKPVFVNICIGVSMIQLSESIFLPVLPMVLMTSFSESDTAKILSIGNVGELLSKLGMAALAYRVRINNRVMLFISAISMAVFRTVLIQSIGYVSVLIAYTAIATTRAVIQITWQLVLVDYAGNKNFVAADCSYQIFWMASLLLGNYIVSLVRDSAAGHIYSIYTLNIFNCVCIVSWAVEFCIRKLSRK